MVSLEEDNDVASGYGTKQRPEFYGSRVRELKGQSEGSVAKRCKPRQEVQSTGECPKHHVGYMLKLTRKFGVTMGSEYNRRT